MDNYDILLLSIICVLSVSYIIYGWVTGTIPRSARKSNYYKRQRLDEHFERQKRVRQQESKELKKLQQMKENGEITQDEYESAMKDIYGKSLKQLIEIENGEI
jgi:hypothetical protein